MKETFARLKYLIAGKWEGEGYAKFPTIEDTHYTEKFECLTDPFKDALFYHQKTFYKNQGPKNGQAVFWDAGFIILKEEKILLHSVQVGGRMEIYELVESAGDVFTFNSATIFEDQKTIRSQRVFQPAGDHLHYELNMATHAAPVFQNHLFADLEKLAS
jgi:THAP4-like, heme-binding beta-barrel domain